MRILKDIPPPRQRPRLYPFGEMEVGDSIIVDLEKRKSVIGAAKSYAQYYGKRFSVRTEADGVRVWRIA
jgi:hypothetical protein